MTKENRERLYKHFRDMEKNYEARSGLNSGCTSTQRVRKNAKASADAILIRHPELKVEEVKEEKEEVKETKSKGKK